MSVEARELTSELWTGLQGQVVNGSFPLGRCLGCSDHSGVFLTRSAGHPAEIAIKLVPTNRALAESQLPRWKRAGGLAHPHVLRLLEWGGCQLDGSPYLYAVMEYADQTLAQLLQQRALTDDEAREMLPPILDGLAYLHGRDLVQGQLKPANILVVGDGLKLASDTIRRFSEGAVSTAASTVYDPPEAGHESSAPAGDVWALGVTLYEALARRQPSRLGEPRGAVVVPVDFSPAFRDVVIRCVAARPQDRLSVTELAAWTRGRSTGSASATNVEPAALMAGEPRTPKPAPPPTATAQTAVPEAMRSAHSAPRPRRPLAPLAVILGGIVILALAWAGLRALRAPHSLPPPAVQASGTAAPPIPTAAPAAATPAPGRSVAVTPPAALHEVIPDVSQGARRTIRGHIKVWVRVGVDQNGSVVDAVADRTGPSRYFQQLAIDAAKKWRFPAVDTPSRRTMQVRFDFSRDSTTAHAVALH